MVVVGCCWEGGGVRIQGRRCNRCSIQHTKCGGGLTERGGERTQVRARSVFDDRSRTHASTAAIIPHMLHTHTFMHALAHTHTHTHTHTHARTPTRKRQHARGPQATRSLSVLRHWIGPYARSRPLFEALSKGQAVSTPPFALPSPSGSSPQPPWGPWKLLATAVPTKPCNRQARRQRIASASMYTSQGTRSHAHRSNRTDSLDEQAQESAA